MEKLATDEQRLKILLQEHQIIHTEISGLIRSIQYCLLSYIGSIGLFTNAVANMIDKKENNHCAAVIFALSQIEFIIIIFSIYNQTELMGKAAYADSIERRINMIVDECIVFWESEIARYFRQPIGKKTIHLIGGGLAPTMITLFYAVSFGAISYSTSFFSSPFLHYMHVVQICEGTIGLFGFILIGIEFKHISNFIEKMKIKKTIR